MILCKNCGIDQSLDNFYAFNWSSCKSCVKARSRKYYQENKERHAKIGKLWVANNSERSREIKQAYKEKYREQERLYGQFRRTHFADKIRESQRRYQQAHKHLYAAYSQAYKARMEQALPLWADLKAITSFYEQASELTRLSGVPHEVDHEIPLHGDLVCGLHVENNLRVVTRSVNRSKSNYFYAEGVSHA